MKKKLLALLLVVIAVLGFSACGEKTSDSPEKNASQETTEGEDFQYVSGADAVGAVGNDDIQIIDVRDPDTYKKGTLEGAINMDLSKPDDKDFQEAFKANISNIDKNKKVYFLCFSGNKCAKGAINILKENGYDANNLYIIEDGAKGDEVSGAFVPGE